MKSPSIVLLIALLTGCTAAPSRPTGVARDDYASIQTYTTQLIQYEMDKNSVAGLSIALVDDQRIVWAQGFGYADLEKKTPATAETLYRVGSISKLFTDSAAMQLAEQGKLDIDQPLRNCLPEFTIKSRYPDATEITPRQLMTHHSGLPRDRMTGFFNSHPRPFTGLVTDIREDYADYPPNRIFSYSNLGIALLGHAVQNQSGQPYAEHMQQALLNPLGMSNSSFDAGLSPSSLMAKGHSGRKAATEPFLRDIPAGGLNSSVADLGRFMSMMFADGSSGGRHILKAESVAEMLRPQNTGVPLDFGLRIGLGWLLNVAGIPALENAGLVASHGGATQLFRSQMYILPGHKLGVVVLSNSDTSGEAVDHIAVEALSLALEAKTGIRQPERKKAQVVKTALPVETVRDYAGAYTTEAGFARVYASGNGLRVDVAGHSLDLVRRSDGLYALDYSLLGIFHIDIGDIGEIGISRRTLNGRDLLVGHLGNEEILIGQRIQPLSNPDAWRKYLGDYEITNLDGDQKLLDRIRLTEEHGFLLVELTPTEAGETVRIPLMPLSDNQGLLLGPLSDGGETVRLVMVDGAERVLVSGYLLKKIDR
ncbi:MAG: beta-lactamase family protein [Gallionella sp.]|jgi:CubicO group peptidase (beta-lactamase class C family)|nr:beta-lactamase family protein [Gallionella sp.]